MKKMILVLIAISLLILACSGTETGTGTEKAISINAAFEPVDQNLKGITVRFKGTVAYFLRLGKVENIADITGVKKKDKGASRTIDVIKFKDLSGQVFYAEVTETDFSDRNYFPDGRYQAIRLGSSTFGGVYRRKEHYLSDSESRGLYEALAHKVCESLVGQKFTASPTNSVFGSFSDSISIASSSFRVGNPEEFTITRFTERSLEEGWYGWYEVRFASGKTGFIKVMNLHYASNGPEVLRMIKARWD